MPGNHPPRTVTWDVREDKLERRKRKKRERVGNDFLWRRDAVVNVGETNGKVTGEFRERVWNRLVSGGDIHGVRSRDVYAGDAERLRRIGRQSNIVRRAKFRRERFESVRKNARGFGDLREHRARARVIREW